MFNSLKKLLQGASAQVNPFDGGKTYGDFNHPRLQKAKPMLPMAKKALPMYRGFPPDITYNPSGRSAYSARTPELAKMGNRYVANPYADEFLGVDPKVFGFPEDRSARPMMLGRPMPTLEESPLQKLLRY